MIRNSAGGRAAALVALGRGVGAGVAVLAACGIGPRAHHQGVRRSGSAIAPGITVLLEDSVRLVQGKRVGLLTNQTGVDASGLSDIALLDRSPRAEQARVRLTAVFSPEHGWRGTEDRTFVPGGLDTASGHHIISLYGQTVLPPPDSILRRLDVLVVDLQDVGTRTWTYVASMVYAMRAAARNHLCVVVLDRPNPITGLHVEGPLLDSGLSNPEEGSPGRVARPYALAPIPLRHGLTMGELALYFADAVAPTVELHIVPARGWRRAQWLDETGLPWVRPSPNLPSLISALLYPALVAFEGSNLSVGRGTDAGFQRVGAPWLDAGGVVRLLAARRLAGVRFDSETFTPRLPTDGKYDNRTLSGVRVVVTDRDRVQAARVGAALLWAIARVNRDSLRLDSAAFDLRFGSPTARSALVKGDDPDAVIDRSAEGVRSFEARARRYLLYR